MIYHLGCHYYHLNRLQANKPVGMTESRVTVKIGSDVVRPLKGEGHVLAWLKKVKLVAKLQKIDKLADFLPLYLEGDALALYLEMSDEDQADVTKLEARLKQAFTEGSFVAFGKLRDMKWSGEQVDVFANDIRKLAGLAGLEGEGLERVVKLTFVNGFSDNISIRLQQLPDIETIDMSALVTAARVLVPAKDRDLAAVAYGTAGHGKSRSVAVTGSANTASTSNAVRGAENFQKRPIKRCFRCNENHMVRFCPMPRPPIICWTCNGEGHVSSQCTHREQGNEKKDIVAPAVSK